MRQASDPFHAKKLLEPLSRSSEQIIDEFTPHTLVHAGYDQASRERTQTLISDLQQFIEDNRDEVETIGIIYSRPHRAGFRYSQIKEIERRKILRERLLRRRRKSQNVWDDLIASRTLIGTNHSPMMWLKIR